jgi:hypothetical protein
VYSCTVNVSGGTVKSESGNAITSDMISSRIANINISGGSVSTNGSGKSAVYIDYGAVKITGGTVLSTNGYAVYLTNNPTLILGGNPTISGRIFSYPEKLSVLTSGDEAFVPNEKIYRLDFPTAQYAVSKIAVMNGRNFISSFVLHNSDWALLASGAHLAIVSAVKVCFDLNGGTGTTPACIGVVQGGKLYAKPSTENFTKSGYVNDGSWYTDPDGVTEFIFGENGTPVTQNMTLYLKWRNTTSIEEIFAPDLNLYPNPFMNELRITNAEGCTLRVSNLAGAIVHIQKINNADATLQLGHLPAGMYLFHFEKDGNKRMVKMVKK